MQLTVTDTNDATHDATATVTVADTTGPTITTSASGLQIACDNENAAALLTAWLTDFGGASAIDDCGGEITWTHDGDNIDVDCADAGTFTVTFTATDSEGNESTTTASFTLQAQGEVDLEITIERKVNQNQPQAGIVVSQTIEYEITVRNIGTADATGVTVSVPAADRHRARFFDPRAPERACGGRGDRDI